MEKIYDCKGKEIKEGDIIIDLIGQQISYYDSTIQEYVEDYKPEQGVVVNYKNKLYAKFESIDNLIDLTSSYNGEPISTYMEIL